MPEFETQVGASFGGPVNHDIGWYLSAMLEDPLADEPLKKAINDYFNDKDEKSIAYKSIIDKDKKFIESCLKDNRHVLKNYTEMADKARILASANDRLTAKNAKLMEMFPLMALLVSLASTVTTYFIARNL